MCSVKKKILLSTQISLLSIRINQKKILTGIKWWVNYPAKHLTNPFKDKDGWES